MVLEELPTRKSWMRVIAMPRAAAAIVAPTARRLVREDAMRCLDVQNSSRTMHIVPATGCFAAEPCDEEVHFQSRAWSCDVVIKGRSGVKQPRNTVVRV